MFSTQEGIQDSQKSPMFTVNNPRLLSQNQRPLVQAEEKYLLGLEGEDNALQAEHTPTLDTPKDCTVEPQDFRIRGYEPLNAVSKRFYDSIAGRDYPDKPSAAGMIYGSKDLGAPAKLILQELDPDRLWQIRLSGLDQHHARASLMAQETIKNYLSRPSPWKALKKEFDELFPESVDKNEKLVDKMARLFSRQRSSSSPWPSENRRKVLPVLMKNQKHLACPDSGSGKNIMRESFALQNGFKIRRKPKDIKQFELGSGKIVSSLGRVYAPTCPVPLVLGMPFLDEAQILGKNRHMLEACPKQMMGISSLLWIGSPRNRMKCSIDGRDLLAVADTGSDLNLMSLNCAKRGGFKIDRRRESRRRIQVGDGSEAETIGQVYIHDLGLDWRKAEVFSLEDTPPHQVHHLISDTSSLEFEFLSLPSETPASRGAIFHILPGLPCDLIFGRDLLDESDAFNLCPDLIKTQDNNNDNESDSLDELKVLINLGPVSALVHCFKQKLLKRPVRLDVDPQEQRDEDRHAEIYRRLKRAEEMAGFEGDGRFREGAVEERGVAASCSLHRDCGYCHRT